MIIHPSTSEFPAGVMIFGLGMLIACLVNPYKLVIAGFLTTALGIAVYLFFKHLIPGRLADQSVTRALWLEEDQEQGFAIGCIAASCTDCKPPKVENANPTAGREAWI